MAFGPGNLGRRLIPGIFHAKKQKGLNGRSMTMIDDIGATFGGIDGVIRQCHHLKDKEHGYFERGFYEVLIAYLEDYKRLKEKQE